MTTEEFCYWLQGFLEMGDPKELNEAQVRMLKSHLNLVFVNVTRETPSPSAEEPKKGVLTDALKGIKRTDVDFWGGRPTVYCTDPTFTRGGVKVC